MCNEYRLTVDAAYFREIFLKDVAGFEINSPPSNRPLGKAFKPTSIAPMIRAIDPANPRARLEVVDRRWAMIPGRFRGTMAAWRSQAYTTTNAKLEILEKPGGYWQGPYKAQRALIPLTSFIEYDEPPGYTGKKGELKRRWEITWPLQGEHDRVRFFAGLWDVAQLEGEAEPIESFTFVTGEPGLQFNEPRPDTGVRLHHRQARVLTLEQGLEWLRLDGPGKAMLEDPEPVGGFIVAQRPRELDAG